MKVANGFTILCDEACGLDGELEGLCEERLLEDKSKGGSVISGKKSEKEKGTKMSS